MAKMRYRNKLTFRPSSATNLVDPVQDNVQSEQLKQQNYVYFPLNRALGPGKLPIIGCVANSVVAFEDPYIFL